MTNLNITDMVIHNTKIRIPLDLAKEFAEMFPDFTRDDMEDWIHHFYVKRTVVSDFAIEKYGGLTDDGYYELTDVCGGPHPYDEIYVQKWVICGSNSFLFDDDEYYLCPTIHEIQAFLRDRHHIQITVYSKSQESWMYRITKPGQPLEDGLYGEDYATYEASLAGGIWRTINEKKNGNF